MGAFLLHHYNGAFSLPVERPAIPVPANRTTVKDLESKVEGLMAKMETLASAPKQDQDLGQVLSELAITKGRLDVALSRLEKLDKSSATIIGFVRKIFPKTRRDGSVIPGFSSIPLGETASVLLEDGTFKDYGNRKVGGGNWTWIDVPEKMSLELQGLLQQHQYLKIRFFQRLQSSRKNLVQDGQYVCFEYAADQVPVDYEIIVKGGAPTPQPIAPTPVVHQEEPTQQVEQAVPQETPAPSAEVEQPPVLEQEVIPQPEVTETQEEMPLS